MKKHSNLKYSKAKIDHLRSILPCYDTYNQVGRRVMISKSFSYNSKSQAVDDPVKPSLTTHEIKLTWKVVVISGVIVKVPPFSVVCGGRMNSLVDAVTLLSSK